MAAMPFVFLQVLFGIVAGDVAGVPTDSGINALLSAGEFSEGSTIGLPFRFMAALPGYFTALVQMVTWDYPFFDGDWNYFRYFLLLPLSIAMTFGLITTLARALFRR
ncbi:hypothetical protein LCGC14_0864830 [marine sediment metagenome]|uniref:Uncharacterized protein n=1 Tax=marine sediment metagenome TaxID=412755 RepID=A0A0F9RR15_9ZZZZ